MIVVWNPQLRLKSIPLWSLISNQHIASITFFIIQDCVILFPSVSQVLTFTFSSYLICDSLSSPFYAVNWVIIPVIAISITVMSLYLRVFVIFSLSDDLSYQSISYPLHIIKGPIQEIIQTDQQLGGGVLFSTMGCKIKGQNKLYEI